MGRVVFADFGYAYLYLCLPFAALELSTFLDPQGGAGTNTTTTASAHEAPLLRSASEVLPPLAAVVVLFVAVGLTYRHLMTRIVVSAAAAVVPVAGAAGNGRRSTLGLVMFPLCVSAGTLQFILLGQAAAAAGHGGALARALGLAALRALPAAATATFFLGMMLIIVVAHVRAGGEGGGGDEGPIHGLPLRLLAKVAAGMAAALVGLMVMALTLHGANTESHEGDGRLHYNLESRSSLIRGGICTEIGRPTHNRFQQNLHI